MGRAHARTQLRKTSLEVLGHRMAAITLKANTIKYPLIGCNWIRRLQELSITTTFVYNPPGTGTAQVVSGPLFYWIVNTHHLWLMAPAICGIVQL